MPSSRPGSTISAGTVENTKIVVQEAADLATIDSTKTYMIDGAVDITSLGAAGVIVPEGGITLWGRGYDVAELYSTAASASLFSSPGGGYSGNVNLDAITLRASGAGSKIFDLDNAGNNSAIEANKVNFGKFGAPGTETTSMGELTGYRQLKFANTAYIRVQDGLTFSGTWSGGFRITETIMLAIPAAVTLHKAGTALDFQGSSYSDMNAVGVPNDVVVFDFAPSNFSRDEGFSLNGARFNLAAVADPIPNMTLTSSKRFFKNCSGVRNTYSGGTWEMTSQAVTAVTGGLPSKIAGTTTYDDLVYWTQTASNAFVFASTVSKDYTVTGGLTVDGGANDEIEIIIRKWDDSASAYVDVRSFTRQIQNLIGGLDVGYFGIEAFVDDVAMDDRIELWVQNNTDNTSVTLLNGSYVNLNVRLG